MTRNISYFEYSLKKTNSFCQENLGQSYTELCTGLNVYTESHIFHTLLKHLLVS